MTCSYRRPFCTAARVVVHTFVMVMIVGALGMFETFGGVLRASGGCSETIEGRRLLRVRLVPAEGVKRAMTDVVKAEVEELWRGYGVDVSWGELWEGDAETKPDLFVHFVDRELGKYPGRGKTAVAWILFIGGTPGQRVNVSIAAATRLLQEAPWLDGRPMKMAPIDLQQRLIGTMIGRALAHEIGHYLLASSTHADEGLMKPLITPHEFVKLGRRHLRLTPDDVRTMRAARLASCQLSASR